MVIPFLVSIIQIKLNALHNARLAFGLIYKSVKVVSKIVKAVGDHQNINAFLATLISLLMILNVFGNALQESIVLPLDFASGVSRDVAAALDQLFKIVNLALQTSIYLIMCAILKNAQEQHI